MKRTYILILTVAVGMFSISGCKKDSPTENEKPDAPEMVSPADSATVLSDTVQLVWRSLPGTVQYSVEVSSAPNFSTLEFSTSITETTFTIQPVLRGWHYWRVRGKNSTGLWGTWNTRTFYRLSTFVKTFG